jgi:hypothetical protein
MSTILKAFIFLLFFASAAICQAQDTILKKNGTKILAKVLEVSTEEIKYKRVDFADGPLYIERKDQIISIRYSNGLLEVFNTSPVPEKVVQEDYVIVNPPAAPVPVKIMTAGRSYIVKGSRYSEKELHNFLLETKDPRIQNLVYKARDNKASQAIGFFAIPLGVTSYFMFIKSIVPGRSQADSDKATALSAVFLAGAITCPILSGISKSKRMQSNREAIRLYNERF